MIKTTPQKSYAYGFLQNILDAEVKSQTKRFGRDDIFVKMVLEMSIERAKEIDYLFQNKPNGKAVSQKCVKEGLNTYSDFLWLNSLHECMKKNL